MPRTLLSDIGPAGTLGIQLGTCTETHIELTAPLALNRNDKGSAFAGSISSILTLAGWALITRTAAAASLRADVMAVTSCIDYSEAVQSDFTAVSEWPESQAKRVIRELRERGRSRVQLEAFLMADGIRCASMTTSYAVRVRTTVNA